ncbi:hypothetical protein BV898_07788 [Hypsibius exemplaris]|uniref:Calponin-homology (CH) domain-containing protein n=1 Tax=Hypsibius exemplaris TaxID=2072580 RepID=A0A1W0WSL8_HYPEX|nr:hypothetical protein BV898_07788 [Hypsibius exemplaris]
MPIEYGIKGQMVNLIAAKRDPGFEAAALRWIFGVLGEPVPDQPIEQVLKNGQVLFRFLQKIRPDLVKGNVYSGELAAKQRENVGSFIDGITKLGLRQSDLFQTEDLYEGKNIPQVLIALQAVGTHLQTSNPDVPAFGPAPKHG